MTRLITDIFDVDTHIKVICKLYGFTREEFLLKCVTSSFFGVRITGGKINDNMLRNYMHNEGGIWVLEEGSDRTYCSKEYFISHSEYYNNIPRITAMRFLHGSHVIDHKLNGFYYKEMKIK